jgi:hypothetical protein
VSSFFVALYPLLLNRALGKVPPPPPRARRAPLTARGMTCLRISERLIPRSFETLHI